MEKVDKVLDIKMEEGNRRLEEARKRHEEHERKSAEEGKFETVEEWSQHIEPPRLYRRLFI